MRNKTMTQEDEGTVVDSLVEKQRAFLELKTWAKDREELSNMMWRVVDPVYEDLIFTEEKAKFEMSNIIRFMNETSKSHMDFAARIRVSSRIPGPLPVFDSNEGMSPRKPRSEYSAQICYPFNSPQYLEALVHGSERNAKLHEDFASEIVDDLLTNVLNKCGDSYTRVSNLHVSKLKAARHKLLDKEKEVTKSWQEHEKTFKHVEQSDFNRGDDRSAHDHKDCWLSERRFASSGSVAQALATDFLRLLRHILTELHELEEWRKRSVKTVLNKYLKKSKRLLGELAASLGSSHAMIDPVGFESTGFEYLKIEGSPDRTPSSSPEESTAPEKKTDDSSSNIKDVIDEFIKEASQFVSPQPLPESELIIKKGIVERQTGLLGKWTNGWLVLTWDRFLHMFRSHDDVAPAWSICAQFVELRRENNTDGGVYVIELREKKQQILPRRTVYFKCLTAQDMNEWLECLKLACFEDKSNFAHKVKELVRVSDLNRSSEHASALAETREKLRQEELEYNQEASKVSSGKEGRRSKDENLEKTVDVEEHVDSKTAVDVEEHVDSKTAVDVEEHVDSKTAVDVEEHVDSKTAVDVEEHVYSKTAVDVEEHVYSKTAVDVEEHVDSKTAVDVDSKSGVEENETGDNVVLSESNAENSNVVSSPFDASDGESDDGSVVN